MKRIFSIKDSDEIDLIFKVKKSVGNGYFALYYQTHDLNYFRFAISIGKKYGNAVERNLAKRRIRYAISKYKTKIFPNFKFIIVVKPKVKELTYEDIQKNIVKLLNKAKIIEKEEIINA